MGQERGASVFDVTPRWCAEQQREPRLLGIKPPAD